MEETFERTSVDGSRVVVPLSSIMSAFAAEVGPGQRGDLREDGVPVEIRSQRVDGFIVVVELRR